MDRIIAIWIVFIALTACTGKEGETPDTLIVRSSPDTTLPPLNIQAETTPEGDTVLLVTKFLNTRIVNQRNQKEAHTLFNDRYYNDGKTLSYNRDHKGVYVSYSDTSIKAFGYRYFSGSKTANAILNPAGRLSRIELWNDYDEATGSTYQFNLEETGVISKFIWRNGVKIDSVAYRREAK